MAFRGNATTARSSHDPAGPDEQEARRPQAQPQPQQQVLEMQHTLGNQAVSAMLSRKTKKQKKPAIPVKGAWDDPHTEPRTEEEILGLIDDVLGSIVKNESKGKAIESYLRTVAGPHASYKSAGQHIASKTVGALDVMDNAQLKELGLTKDEVNAAQEITLSTKMVWNCAVFDGGIDSVEGLKAAMAKKKYGKLRLKLCRLTDDDLQRMLQSRKVFGELTALLDKHGGRKSMKDKTDPTQKALRSKLAAEFAATETCKQANLRQTDIEVYIRKGFGEDAGGWQRIALSRPSPEGVDDNLDVKVQSAAESGGGWKMPKVDIERAVRNAVAAGPNASDITILRESIKHHSGGAGGGYYGKTAESNFRSYRTQRAAGKPWSPPTTTDDPKPTPAPDVPKPAPAPDDPAPVPSGGGGGGSEPAEPEGDVEEGGGSESETEEGGGAGKADDKGDWASRVQAAHNPLVMLPLMFTLTGPLALGGSVGNGGKNDPGDIAAVIVRLKALGRLEVPTDPATLTAAIYAAQKQLAGMKKGDGVIDATGKTIDALNEAWSAKQKPANADPAPAPAPSGGGDKPAPAPTPAPAPAPGPAPAPDAGGGGGIWDDIGGWLEDKLKTDKSKDYSADDLALTGSVGLKAANAPADVSAVRDRLTKLGYTPGASDEELVTAIKVFQRETFVVSKSSGRADGVVGVGGETHQALNVGAPRSGSGRKDSDVAAIVMASEDPGVVALRTKITDLQEFSGGIKANQNEQQGADRDELVEKIGELRAEVDELDVSRLEEADAAAVKIWGHRALNKLAPFYSQERNVDLLENASGEGKFRTCNITAFAMCLEALGKSPADFPKDALQPLRDARRYKGKDGHNRWAQLFDKENAKDKAEAEDDSHVQGEDADVLGLRLPDFMQLAMIAKRVEEGMTLLQAQNQAWDDILFLERIAPVVEKFGVSAYPRYVGGTGKTTQEKLRSGIGGLLDSGVQLVGSTGHHFVKVEGISDKGIVVDDPGGIKRLNKTIPWDEADTYLKRVYVVG